VTANDGLDDIDIRIAELLQENGRMHRGDIAEKVELSLPAASERLRKLEEKGVITHYAAVLDHKKVGLDITAFIFVQIDTSSHYQNFIHKAKTHPDILECHAVTGDGSHLLKIRTQNTDKLEKLLSLIQSWQGVSGTRTSIVLSTAKETTAISLKHMK